MPDQLRADFLGCYGASFVQTPNIDKLTQQGLQFNRALSPSPICIPARASLLTGHNSLSTGQVEQLEFKADVLIKFLPEKFVNNYEYDRKQSCAMPSGKKLRYLIIKALHAH